MSAVLINTLTVIIGSVIGMFLKKESPGPSHFHDPRCADRHAS